jgi:hypothetical protein
MHLKKVNKGVFCVAFLEKEDYKNPEGFVPSKRDIYVVNMDVNNEEFKKVMEKSLN